jgi:hypothetical protein
MRSATIQRFFSVSLTRGPAEIHRERGAGDHAGGLRAEIGGKVRDLGRLDQPLDRGRGEHDLLDHLLRRHAVRLGLIGDLGVDERRANVRRADRVDRDAMLAAFERGGARDADQAVLGRQLVRAFEGHTHHVLDVAWSGDGRTLASGSADQTVKVWDARTGEQHRTIAGFGKEVTGIAFLADTPQIVASCGDGTVYVKRTEDGGNVRSLTGGTDFMYSAAATADGRLLAAGGMDSVIRVWSAEGQVFATFEPPPTSGE